MFVELGIELRASYRCRFYNEECGLSVRNIATEFSPVTGMLGSTSCGTQKGFSPDFKGAVDALKGSGFRISDSVVISILKFIGPFSLFLSFPLLTPFLAVRGDSHEFY